MEKPGKVVLYAGTRHHREFKILRQECPRFWQALYVLLEMAFECDDDGQVYVSSGFPYTIKQLSRKLGLDPNQTEKQLESARLGQGAGEGGSQLSN